jgi:hypothetical protein
VINDVNHFCVSKSPNSIPRTIMKKIDTTVNSNDRAYARKINHHGNVNCDRFFLANAATLLTTQKKETS